MYSATVLKLFAGLSIVGVLSACGGSDPPPPEKLAKAVENLQCEAPRFTLGFLDGELAASGVSVLSKSCAFDGLARIAACGAPSVYLRLIEVPGNQAELARALGYRELSEFPEIIPINCPSQ